ncbi:hypothetical protein IWQ60_010542 [Tieghemiomyces parasiticus]|uniref:Extracellular metalloproteinase n=1 Tax=Tieghemiomyces parasiticus TaxID=78921 RepID=A0A9W7ZSR1_9FUNG|nr:hypothetical protein IWQ60_010542 [Tieghemiomyces parasiticus]
MAHETRQRGGNIIPSLNHAVYVIPETPLATAGQASSAGLQADPKQVALQLALEKYGLKGADVVVKNFHTSADTGVSHVYLRQLVNGLEVTNADMNVNVDTKGTIISYGSTFLTAGHPAIQVATNPQIMGTINAIGSVTRLDAVNAVLGHQGRPTMSRSTASRLTANHERDEVNTTGDESVQVITRVPGSVDDRTVTRYTYIINSQGELEPVWDVILRTDDDWVNAHVSRHSGKLVSYVSWRADDTYRVYTRNVPNPDKGDRELVSDPADTMASPKGWHAGPDDSITTDTSGNNVFAQENLDGKLTWEGKKRPDGGSQLAFDFPIDLSQEPVNYLDAAVTNLYYWNNLAHDIFYNYGFDEESGNFQNDNFGEGGEEGDAVLAFAQGGDGMNNAWFSTPPDGENGVMNMYIFDTTSPNRDGDLEADVIIHEYTHGVSNRLTGGAANSNCLGTLEAGGMGEGWSDIMAILFQLKPSDTNATNFAIGSYVEGSAKGFRRHLYSTSLATNPTMYSDLNDPSNQEVHNVGELWAEMLYEVVWALIDEAGFEPNLANSDSQAGNILAMKYIVNGFKLQPCNPTFLSARDAIIQAEKVISDGEYECTLWRAFAKRGLGKFAINAFGDYFNNSSMPLRCLV